MKPLTIIVIVFIAAAFLAIISIILPVASPPSSQFDIQMPSSLEKSVLGVEKEFGADNNTHDTYAYAPHYVAFHLHPEREGVSIVAWASDSLPPTTGRTDNKSEVVLALISSAKYNILIDDNRCSYYIVPIGNNYTLEC